MIIGEQREVIQVFVKDAHYFNDKDGHSLAGEVEFVLSGEGGNFSGPAVRVRLAIPVEPTTSLAEAWETLVATAKHTLDLVSAKDTRALVEMEQRSHEAKWPD